MPAPDVHTRLLQPLNSTQIPHMVTGGLAAIIYGEPRAPHGGEAALNTLRDRARELAPALGAEREMRELDALVGALLRSRPAAVLRGPWPPRLDP